MKISELGRSMVEMLGVLAIIGVLSIGGIAGYTLAMNRHRANEILDAATKVAVAAMSANGGLGGYADLGDLGGWQAAGVPFVKNNSDISCNKSPGKTGQWAWVMITLSEDPSPQLISAIEKLAGDKFVGAEGRLIALDIKNQ